MPLIFNPIKRIVSYFRLRRVRRFSDEVQYNALSPDEQSLMINALYLSPKVMIFGIGSTLFAAITSFAQSYDFIYLLFLVAFGFSGFFRYSQGRAFTANADAHTFVEWRSMAISSGVLQCSLLGLYTAYAVLSHNHFNELLAFCLTMGNLVGVPSRNFSSRRLINLQMMCIGTPIIFAFLIQFTWQYTALALLSAPLFLSMAHLAKQSRNTLLQVVRRKLEIKQLLARFDTATNFMQHGFMIIDENNQIAVANTRAFLLLLGQYPSSDNWIGKNYEDLLHHAVETNHLSSTAKEQLAQIPGISSNNSGTHKTVTKTVSGVYLESSISSRDGQLVVLLEDVTERIRTADRITYMATHDSLTGLCNREHFHDLFNQHLSQRADGQCLLAVIDLDDFKHINDTYGHAAGDELLCSAAATIEKVCDDYAIACRFGGDEFVIFAPLVKDEEDINAFPKRLLSELSKKAQLSHGSVQPNASIGIVLEDHSLATSDGMFAKADLALYESKAKARGGWRIYEAAMDANHRERQQLKDDLSLAVSQDELSLQFQPIVNLDSKRVGTFEALSRWYHPDHGDVSPGVFIPLAEEMGIVGDITLIVLRKSIEQCKLWPEPVGVSVNLSAIDFDNPNLVNIIDQLLFDAELRPDRLEVEITEGTFIENKKRVSDAVMELRKLGVRIALDDFGTGYSNFSYLQEVSLNKLKIDRCFVKDILENHRSALLLRGISDIAKSLDLAVTVEGIETEEQLIAVSKIANIDNVQGWIFSKSVDGEQALELAKHEFVMPDIYADTLNAPLGNLKKQA